MSQLTGEEDTDVVIVTEATPQMTRSSVSKFSIKFINPRNQGGYAVDKWEGKCDYDGVVEMKSDLRDKLEDLGYISTQDGYCFGFVIPGHGVKGKQHSIEHDEDVGEMYRQYHGRKEIVLWVKLLTASQRKQKSSTSCRKRLSMAGTSGNDSDGESLPSKRSKKSNSESGQKCGPNYGNHLKKMTEVDSIVEELEGLHGESGKYTPEQFRVWAYMLQTGKHVSYESPPVKPFFKSAKVPKGSTQEGISPGKRLNMRSECINQLDKWHSLMERGAITVKQYQEFQDTILVDMKKF